MQDADREQDVGALKAEHCVVESVNDRYVTSEAQQKLKESEEVCLGCHNLCPQSTDGSDFHSKLRYSNIRAVGHPAQPADFV